MGGVSVHFFSVSRVHRLFTHVRLLWRSALRCPLAADSGRGRPELVTPPLPLYVRAVVST